MTDGMPGWWLTWNRLHHSILCLTRASFVMLWVAQSDVRKCPLTTGTTPWPLHTALPSVYHRCSFPLLPLSPCLSYFSGFSSFSSSSSSSWCSSSAAAASSSSSSCVCHFSALLCSVLSLSLSLSPLLCVCIDIKIELFLCLALAPSLLVFSFLSLSHTSCDQPPWSPLPSLFSPSFLDFKSFVE